MATTFLEPGGDADFAVANTNGFWKGTAGGSGTVVTATDFVHGTHTKSLKCNTNNSIGSNTLTTAGSRFSAYIYIVTLPTNATFSLFRARTSPGLDQDTFSVRITSGGVLQIWSGDAGTPAQIGTNGSTLSTGQWYRISLAYTITSTTVNRFELFVNGTSSISITNATLNGTSCLNFVVGSKVTDVTADFRSSDHYIDNSTTLTDPGNIWVTAKRPNANGTTNGFTTQIGSGGSGYGTGHSPQVNERALSTTNGWSMIGAGSAITEEYNIEAKGTGDIDISKGTVIDYLGWVSASSLSSETASIIVNNVTSNISLTSTITLFTKIAASATYPAGTGTDIGIITTTALTTVSLYECGIVVAFIPAATINVSDSSAVGESVSLSIQSFPNKSDSTAVSDTPTITEVDLINPAADSTAIGESVTIRDTLQGVNVSDSTAIGEVVTMRLFSNVSVSESTAIGEAVTMQDFLQGISVSDSTTVSDADTTNLRSFVSVSESTTVGEAVVLEDFEQGVVISDSTAVGETVTMELFSFVNVSDQSAIGETITMAGTEYISVTDSSAISDTPTITLPAIGAESISVTDSTTVGELITLTESAATTGFSFVVWID